MTKARDLADRSAADLTAVTAGTGISITDGAGPIPTITNAGVTAVTSGTGIAVTNGTGPIPTVAVTSSVVTLTDTQILTNKTLKSPKEITTVSTSAATGTISFNLVDQAVLYYSGNATGNFTLNFRGDGSTTLSSLMSVGDAVTAVFLNTNASTAYYATAYQIDGSSITPKWQGGSAPASGNTNSIDAYSVTIIKTAATPTYVALASQTKFA